MMRVTVIGQGYVGQTVTLAALRAGYKVFGYDIDTYIIEKLNVGVTHVPGINSNELKHFLNNGDLIITSDFGLCKHSEVYVICVPTPLNSERNPDLKPLNNAVELIGRYATRDALVINESTSYPGTLRNLIAPVIDGLNPNSFKYAVAPERVDPGNSYWLISNTPRVIAGLDTEASKKAIDFYSEFCADLYLVQVPEVAEASKLLENTFRQVNISLVNEFAEIAHALNFSAVDAIKAAATKPFGFMQFLPSIGVGGHCIPVDPVYLSSVSKSVGYKAKLIELSNQINSSTPLKVVNRISKIFGGNLNGIRIQIAGISYKQNIKDIRESPAIILMNELRSCGAIVIWHDPIVKVYKDEISVEMSTDIDLGLIITPHDQIVFSKWSHAEIKVLDLSPSLQNFGWPKFF